MKSLWVFLLLASIPISMRAQIHAGDPLRKLVPPLGLYFSLPQGPVRVHQADQQYRGGGDSRIFIFTKSDIPQLLSLRQTEIDNRSVITSRLPSLVNIGESSLFYMKDDESVEMVFTNSSRTRVYYASMATDYPVVSKYSCGPFKKISAIHLVELNGTLQRLIVADEKDNQVYSYQIDTNNPNLCINGQQVRLAKPVWIRSPNTLVGDTVIFVGSEDRSALNLTRYRATDLAVLTATEVLSNTRGNSFGIPFVDPQTSDLYIPIRVTKDDEHGDDHIRHYLADFSDSSSFKTCRSPDQILQDFEAAEPFRYVLCTSARKIYVFNKDHERVAILDAGSSPKKMLVSSDGTNRYIAVTQSDKRIQLHSIPVTAENVQSEVLSTNLSLPIQVNDAGHFGSLGAVVLVGNKDNQILIVDLDAQSLSDQIYLPREITDMAPEDSDTLHFISKSVDSAYTWDEIQTDVFELTAYTVGNQPVQIERRANLLYVLNQGSDELSIVDTTNASVKNLGIGSHPVQFDFDTTLDQLWVANKGSDSFSIVDITPGAEALIGQVGLALSPNQVRFQTSDGTLYFAGGSFVDVFQQSNFTRVKTENIGNRIHGLELVDGGVYAFSRNSNSAYYIDRTSLGVLELDRPAHFLVSNRDTAIFGSMTNRTLTTSDAFSSVVKNFEALFSTSSFFSIWESQKNQLRFFPYDLVSKSSFPSITMDLAIRPDLVKDDGSDNIWVADSVKKLFQRIHSGFQSDQIRNRRKNHPISLAVSENLEKIYVGLQNANLLAVINADTGNTAFYSSCERVRQVLVEEDTLQVYVLCPGSQSMSVFKLDAQGDVIGHGLVALDERPEKMILHDADDLLFVIHSGSSTLLAFDTTNMSLARRLELPTGPRDLDLDAANNILGIVSESSKVISLVDTTNFSVSTIESGQRALDRIVIGKEVHAFSRSLKSLFHESLHFTASNTLSRTYWPAEVGYSSGESKVFITYPLASAVKVLDEDAQTEVDLDLGAMVVSVFVYDALDMAFFSAPETDELVVVDTKNLTLEANINLTNGCRPGQMRAMQINAKHYLYVVCEGNDSIELVDLGDFSLGNSLSVRISEM